MAYSELGVVNLALQRLGIKLLTESQWSTHTIPSAAAAYAAWEYIRNEVLEAADWRFAKTRTTLSKIPPRVDLNCGDGKHLYVEADKYLEDTEDISIEIYSNSSDALSVVVDPTDSTNILIKLANATAASNTATLIQTALRALSTVNGVSVALWTVTANAEWTASAPTSGIDLDEEHMVPGPMDSFDYAYLMPSGFLRVCTKTENDRTVNPTGGYSTRFDENGMIQVKGTLYSYVIESLPDDRLVLLTDYDDDQADPLEVVYIRLVTDPTKWTAQFISCLAFRLAAELALPLTEGKTKFEYMMNLYEGALKMAKALNQSSDYVKDETGSMAWEFAGR